MCLPPIFSLPPLQIVSPTSNSAASGKLQLSVLPTTSSVRVCIRVGTSSAEPRCVTRSWVCFEVYVLGWSCSQSNDARIVCKHPGLTNTTPRCTNATWVSAQSLSKSSPAVRHGHKRLGVLCWSKLSSVWTGRGCLQMCADVCKTNAGAYLTVFLYCSSVIQTRTQLLNSEAILSRSPGFPQKFWSQKPSRWQRVSK